MRIWRDSNMPNRRFTLDFLTADIETHAAMTEHKAEIERILSRALLAIQSLQAPHD